MSACGRRTGVIHVTREEAQHEWVSHDIHLAHMTAGWWLACPCPGISFFPAGASVLFCVGSLLHSAHHCVTVQTVLVTLPFAAVRYVEQRLPQRAGVFEARPTACHSPRPLPLFFPKVPRPLFTAKSAKTRGQTGMPIFLRCYRSSHGGRVVAVGAEA